MEKRVATDPLIRAVADRVASCEPRQRGRFYPERDAAWDMLELIEGATANGNGLAKQMIETLLDLEDFHG